MAAVPLRRLAASLVLLACAAHAAELGTLFTTPEERARLDRLRKGEPDTAGTGAAVEPQREPVITGYVKRSDGRNTVWIDGVPVAARGNSAKVLDEPSAVKPGGRESNVRVEPTKKP